MNDVSLESRDTHSHAAVVSGVVLKFNVHKYVQNYLLSSFEHIKISCE